MISDKARRSQKLWKLFTYLLTNRSRLTRPETIVEHLWFESESADPKAALHNLLYRLRKLLHEELPRDRQPIEIEFSQGCYCLKMRGDCWCDVDVFSVLIEEAQELEGSDPVRAVEAYREAIGLYGGYYLPDYAYETWVLPIRYHYHRLYIESLGRLVELLRSASRYQEVLQLCEEAFLAEPLLEAENLHHRYMEALAKEGRTKDALEHYRFVRSRMHREMGVQVSDELRRLQKMIRADRNSFRTEKVEEDIGAVRSRLVGSEEYGGALVCDRDVFRHLYDLEARRSERKDERAVLLLFTVCGEAGDLEESMLDRAMAELREVLVSNLRRGDAICQWNEAQFLVLLSGLGDGDMSAPVDRIQGIFAGECTVEGAVMSVQFEVVCEEAGQKSGLR